MDEMTSRLVTWIVERHRIYLRKTASYPKPWTKDNILRTYRFCNVYRELDTVTQWIAQNWRKPHQDDPELWFAMAVARLVNWPSTLEALGYPVPWDEGNFIEVFKDLKVNGEKVWGGAYIVSTNGNVAAKHVYIAKRVLSPLWKARASNRPRRGDTLAAIHARLTSNIGVGSFIGGQIIADVKYAKPLKKVGDWHTFAVPGPGSLRGMNRVMGRDVNESQRTKEWQVELSYLQDNVNKEISKHEMEPLHGQDMQNCLCEFDKYERVRLGEGKPKALYPGV